jgi:hypothetical protein
MARLTVTEVVTAELGDSAGRTCRVIVVDVPVPLLQVPAAFAVNVAGLVPAVPPVALKVSHEGKVPTTVKGVPS